MFGESAPKDMEPMTNGKISRVGGIHSPASRRRRNSSGGSTRPRMVLMLNSCRPASSAGSVSMEMRVKLMRSSTVRPETLRRPPRFWASPCWLWRKLARRSLSFRCGPMASFGQTEAHMEQPMQRLAMSVLWRMPVKWR